MGTRGPAPKTAVEPVDPNAFKDPLPPAPSSLSADEVAEYERVREIGGSHYKLADLEAVIDFAQTTVRERQVSAGIDWANGGTVIREHNGSEYADPRISIVTMLGKKKLALAQKLGLTPADRARLLGGVASKPAENPLLAEIRSAQNLKVVSNG